MDADRFDHLTRFLATIGTRRGVLSFLAALPLSGLLATLLADEDAAAKDRRRRRKARHKRRSRKRKSNRKGKRKGKQKCTPARLCAGQCGTVKKKKCKPVDCGSCACDPPCPVCQSCDATTTRCAPNGAVDGQVCGDPGQICTQGTCGCGAQACFAAGGCCAGAACVPTDFKNDPSNCGSCRTVCAAGTACEAGVCCLPPTADLQTAVDAPGDTLTLCAGTWPITSTIRINKDLTLDGAGAGQTILDGGDAVRVLRIDPGNTVTFQDLTVTRGHAADPFPGNTGGGIFNEGTLTLVGAAVTDSSAVFGGGISNTGTLTLLTGSRVAGNTGTGGGISNASSGTVTLAAGSLVGGDRPEDANKSTSFSGGIQNNGTLTLQNGSRVAGNTAIVGGGIGNTIGTVTLESGSRVSGNAATDSGGGISTDGGGTVTLKSGSRVSGNSANSGGGVFADTTGTATLETGALVCENQPSASQCAGPGTFNGPGTCPNPAGACPV